MFPGGVLVGLVLILNLIARPSTSSAPGARPACGSSTRACDPVRRGVRGRPVQVDTNMSIEEGQTVNYVQSYQNMELAVIDTTDPT